MDSITWAVRLHQVARRDACAVRSFRSQSIDGASAASTLTYLFRTVCCPTIDYCNILRSSAVHRLEYYNCADAVQSMKDTTWLCQMFIHYTLVTCTAVSVVWW